GDLPLGAPGRWTSRALVVTGTGYATWSIRDHSVDARGGWARRCRTRGRQKTSPVQGEVTHEGEDDSCLGASDVTRAVIRNGATTGAEPGAGQFTERATPAGAAPPAVRRAVSVRRAQRSVELRRIHARHRQNKQTALVDPFEIPRPSESWGPQGARCTNLGRLRRPVRCRERLEAGASGGERARGVPASGESRCRMGGRLLSTTTACGSGQARGAQGRLTDHTKTALAHVHAATRAQEESKKQAVAARK